LGTFGLNATNVTFDGFTFTNIKGRTIDTYYNADNFTMRNCILQCPALTGIQHRCDQFGAA